MTEINIPVNFTTVSPGHANTVTGELAAPQPDRPTEYVVVVITCTAEPVLTLHGGNGRFLTRIAALLWVEEHIANDPSVTWRIIGLHNPDLGYKENKR